MYSLKEVFPICIGEDKNATFITITAIRMANDINGNPRHKIHVWHNKQIWSPKVKGYRRSKDDSYVLKSSFDLYESMNTFSKVFEESINEGLLNE